MEFKAIMVDVDGTITFSDRSLDCRAVEALRSLKMPVVIATGNILCFARATSKLVGTGGTVIAENGGAIQCGIVEYDTTHFKECEEAFEFLNKHFALEKLDPEYRKTEIGLRRNFDVERARELLSEYPEVGIVDTGFAVHIKSKSINKGTGLKRIAELMGLDARDFVAIGDSPNDIEMLKASGFGVAVGNAHPALKEVADMVTEGEHGAGVEEAVRYLEGRDENMQVKELILKEIEKVPEQYLVEVLDFIRFLEIKALEEGIETAIASETSLKKDWLRPEEEGAWRDL